MRILVRGTNWIGDAVMSLPAIERLRQSFPDAHITLLATPRTTALFEGYRYIDQLIQYKRREEGVAAFTKTLSILREEKYDAALLFQNAFEAALLTFAARIPVRVGYNMQHRGALLTHSLPPPPKNRHQIFDYLDIVTEFENLHAGKVRVNNPASPPIPKIETGRISKTNSDPIVIFIAGATNSRAKCWLPEKFAELGDRLITKANARIIFLGASSEAEVADHIIGMMNHDRAINLSGKTNVSELINLIAGCDVVVCNDTGPAHIAAALGMPTITLFGPTNEYETAPVGINSHIIRADGIECARCMYRDCPIDHKCMTNITVDQVYNAASLFLPSSVSESSIDRNEK